MDDIEKVCEMENMKMRIELNTHKCECGLWLKNTNMTLAYLFSSCFLLYLFYSLSPSVKRA